MPRSNKTGYIAGTLFVLFATALFLVGGAPVAAQEGEAGGEKQQGASSLTEKFDAFIGEINGVIAGALFWDVAFGAVNIGEEDKAVDGGDHWQRLPGTLPPVLSIACAVT